MLFAISHSFVNIFADGRSDIKTILFFLYFIFLLAVYFLFKKKILKKIKWLYFGITILTAYIYGLILQIIYTISNNLPLNSPSITGGNGEISYSSLQHSHIAKATIGIFFSHLDKVDIGGAYLGSFSNWVFFLGSVLIITMLFEAVIYFTTSFKYLLKDQNNRQIFFLITGYALLSFSLIKTAVDGGILQPSFIISVLFIILFSLRYNNKLSGYNYYISFIIGVILMLTNLYLSHLKFGDGWLLIESATLIFLYNLIFYLSKKKINYKILALFIIMFFVSWYFYAYRDLGIYKYSNFIIRNNENVYFFNKQDQSVELYKNSREQTLKQLAKELDRNINYLPIAVSGITCKDNLPYHKISFTILTNEPVIQNSFTSSLYINIKSSKSLLIGKKWKTNIIIYRHPCLPEIYSVINSELEKSNIKNYIYYNISGL